MRILDEFADNGDVSANFYDDDNQFDFPRMIFDVCGYLSQRHADTSDHKIVGLHLSLLHPHYPVIRMSEHNCRYH